MNFDEPKEDPRSTNFIFLSDSQTSSAAKQAIRVHASREGHRQKRRQGTTSLRPVRGGNILVWNDNTPGLPAGQLDSSSGYTVRNARKRHLPEVARKHRLELVASSTKVVQGAYQMLGGSIGDCKLPISDILGAGRRDPFGQYPFAQRHAVDFLIDYCKLISSLITILNTTYEM